MAVISAIVDFFNVVGNFLWGPWTQIFLLCVGAYLLIGTKFYVFRRFGYIMKNTLGKMFKKQETDTKGLTSVQAVLSALAGTIGMGNISGTASAIAVGGPGAVFWMWLFAFFGMSVKTCEVTLAVHYRDVDKDGTVHGGPMYYMKKALNAKVLAIIFSIGLFFNALLMAGTMQLHTVVEAADASYGWNPYVVAAVLVVLMAFAVLGGVKSVGKVCGVLVPFMTVIWIALAIISICFNVTEIPRVFAQIFEGAFNGTAATGGFTGATIALAVQQGAARGTGSNDAGVGVAPCVHATADVSHPFLQGMWGTAEVFIDTIIVCTMTALIILLPENVWNSGETGVALTLKGLTAVLPAAPANAILNICVAAFCFSTALVFYIYYETASINLFGKKSFKYIRWLYFIFPLVFAGYSNVNALWNGFANTATALCLLPNLVALVLLAKPFFGLIKDWEGDHKYDTAKVDGTDHYIKVSEKYIGSKGN